MTPRVNLLQLTRISEYQRNRHTMGKIETITNHVLIDENKIEDPKLGDKPITGDRYYSKEFMDKEWDAVWTKTWLIACLLYTSPSPRDATLSRMPSSA